MEKGKIRETMRAIKQIPKDKLEDLRCNIEGMSRMKVVDMIMQEEGWTYEETLDACIGENRVPRYSLYYKMSDPTVVLNLKSKKGKEAFAASLPEDEREIFIAEQDQIQVGKEITKAFKRNFGGKK